MRNLNVKVNFSSPNQPKIIQPSQIFKGDTYGFNNITGARIFFNSIQSQNKYYFRTYTTSKFISLFLKFGSRILRKISKKTHKKILKFLRKIALYVLSKEVEE